MARTLELAATPTNLALMLLAGCVDYTPTELPSLATNILQNAQAHLQGLAVPDGQRAACCLAAIQAVASDIRLKGGAL
jgi:hypothetical protein